MANILNSVIMSSRKTRLPPGESGNAGLPPAAVLFRRAGDRLASMQLSQATEPLPTEPIPVSATPAVNRDLAKLIAAVRADNLPEARRLIETSNVDINGTDVYGKTPLMHAASLDLTKIIEYLLGKGADANLRSTLGHTALDIARIHGCYENGPTMRLLKRHTRVNPARS